MDGVWTLTQNKMLRLGAKSGDVDETVQIIPEDRVGVFVSVYAAYVSGANEMVVDFFDGAVDDERKDTEALFSVNVNDKFKFLDLDVRVKGLWARVNGAATQAVVVYR